MNKPTKLGIVLVPILALLAIIIWHHRPADTDDVVHYFDTLESAHGLFQEHLSKHEGARIIGIADTSNSMGWAQDTSYHARAVIVPWELNKMPHRAIGGFYRGNQLVIHRYFRLAHNIYSVAGDNNQASDERITEDNHRYRVVFVAIWPR